MPNDRILRFKVIERVTEKYETIFLDANDQHRGHHDAKIRFCLEPPVRTRFGVTPAFELYVPEPEAHLYPPGAVFSLHREPDEPAPITEGRRSSPTS